jgi:hypothetical protein
MKVLFDIYCNSSIQSAYLQSCLPSQNQPRVSRASKNDLFGPPSGGICDSFEQLTFKAKNRAYQRFYQALTAHWVAIEFAWLAKIRLYREAADRKRFSYKVRDMWTTNDSRTLQEKLDIVEIVDFVWIFLVRRIFHKSPFLYWFDTIDDPFDDLYYRAHGTSALRRQVERFVRNNEVDQIPALLCDPGFV